MIKIGTSRDFNICNGVSFHPTTQQPISCIHFVNVSIEKICDKHKAELRKRQLVKVAGNRVGISSSRVDINDIRRRQ